MGLLNKLQEEGSTLSRLDGSTPPIPNFKLSKTHYQYSLNGQPLLVGKPSPSTLDLNGNTPPEYLNNLPE